MKRTLRYLLVAAFAIGCASTRSHPETAVRSYLSARTLDEALAQLAPDYRLWFGARSGEGMTRSQAAQMLEWDYALNPRHDLISMRSNGREVTAQVHEDNDFSLLIGFPGWDATSTYTVDENGRITSQLYVPTGPTEWRPYLDEPLRWITEHHPDALPRIFPNGKLRQTRETAREWVALLRAWRAATGRPDPSK